MQKAPLPDPFHLNRFVQAQQPIWPSPVVELRAGQKQSHWMWFVFPQLAGLGHSSMAQRYAIRSLSEARAYAAHPLLGERLRAATAAVLDIRGCSIEAVFGYPDDRKFHSCMTLFAAAGGFAAADPPDCFSAALLQYFSGERDSATLRLLGDEA